MVLIIYTVGSNSILLESLAYRRSKKWASKIVRPSVFYPIWDQFWEFWKTFYHSKLWFANFFPSFSYRILIILNNQVLVWVLVWYFQVHQKQPKLQRTATKSCFAILLSIPGFHLSIILDSKYLWVDLEFILIIMVSLSLSRYEVAAFNSN